MPTWRKVNGFWLVWSYERKGVVKRYLNVNYWVLFCIFYCILIDLPINSNVFVFKEDQLWFWLRSFWETLLIYWNHVLTVKFCIFKIPAIGNITIFQRQHENLCSSFFFAKVASLSLPSVKFPFISQGLAQRLLFPWEPVFVFWLLFYFLIQFFFTSSTTHPTLSTALSFGSPVLKVLFLFVLFILSSFP